MKHSPVASEFDGWPIVDRLFQHALDLEPAQRRAWLNGTGVDQAVCAEVQRLLELHERVGIFLVSPATGTSADLFVGTTNGSGLKDHEGPATETLSPATSEHVGRFRLVRLLSSGGMGDVWLAERADEQFQQTVAVKLFRAQRESAHGVERFLRERQTLARLEHPSIARLIDGGMMPSGIPYLVMEFVDGAPIDEYCVENNLDRRARVALLREVCAAVQFAHQNLVIHRDIKPANILVTKEGRTKLLDFGVAQWRDAMQPEEHTDPEANRAPFTVDYASPEQLAGQGCTTASDVFSLGVTLQRLLRGDDGLQHRGSITRFAERWASGKNGPRSSGDRRWTMADDPHAPPCDLADDPLLEPGPKLPLPTDAGPDDDLHWILGKALQTNPTQRYTTAKELGDELGRWLHGFPVEARQGGAWYRTMRLMRRNAVLACAAALMMAILLTSTVFVTLAWRRAKDDRDTAHVATRFIGSILTSTSPFARQTESGDTSTKEVLAMTSRQASLQLQNLPEVELQVRFVLAQTYVSLWQWREVLRESQRALQLIAIGGAGNKELEARWLTFKGRAQTWLLDAEAVATQRQAIAIRTELHGIDHADVAEAKIALGFALWRTAPSEQWPQADAAYRDGIETFRRVGVTCSSDYARSLYSYAHFLSQFAPSENLGAPHVREAATCYATLPDLPDRYSLGAQSGYAHLLLAEGNVAAASAEFFAFSRMTPSEMDGEEPIRAAFWTLGRLELLRDNHVAAYVAFRRALRGECLARRALGIDARRWIHLQQQIEAADNVYDLFLAASAITGLWNVTVEAHAGQLLLDIATVGRLALETGRGDEVRDIVADLDQRHQEVAPDAQWRRNCMRGILAEASLRAGEHEEALREGMHAYRSLHHVVDFKDLHFQLVIRTIVRANDLLGHRQRADQFRALLLPWE